MPRVLFGDYQLCEGIGANPAATQYLARRAPPGGGALLALRIHPHLTAAPYSDMFAVEARTSSRVVHPHVARVHEVRKHEGALWVVREYVHGETLADIVGRGRERGAGPSLSFARSIVAGVADGLHAAHELSSEGGAALHLVHRNVRPGTLLVTYDGIPKVTDFGVAHCIPSAELPGGHIEKLAYMSPEQVRGEPIDRRTDVFALGVVLWELAAARPLFPTDGDLETLERVQACRVPSLGSVGAECPSSLEDVIMTALSASPEARYPTARAFAEAIRATSSAGHDRRDDDYVLSLFAERARAHQELVRRWADA